MPPGQEIPVALPANQAGEWAGPPMIHPLSSPGPTENNLITEGKTLDLPTIV